MKSQCILAVIVYFLSALIHESGSVSRGRGVEGHNRAVVCYVGTWATYRPGRGQFSLEHIDPTLCTHIVYAFAGLNSTSFELKSLDPYNDLSINSGKGSYKRMTALKERNPHLKVTLAVGGWNEGSANYSLLASNPSARQVFSKSVVRFLEEYNFDGLDVDWEFPTKRGGRPEDRENFVELLKDIRKEFGNRKWLLTAAISANIDTIKDGYDLFELNSLLDLVHLMCYDYHGSWDLYTGVNAPLRSNQVGDSLTVEKSVEYVLNNGVHASKLVLGVPLYGRTFTLQTEESTGKLGEITYKDKGFQGPFTKADGFLGFNEICMELKRENWTHHWDNETATPFATKGNHVVSYEDSESIRQKVVYAVDKNLAGIMVWSMDTDDFHGDCGQRFPLMNTISDNLADALDKRQRKPILNDPNDSNTSQPSTLLFVILPFVLSSLTLF